MKKNKVCICSFKNAFYFDFGLYRCQYCEGLLQDLDRVRKIIDYNTPVKEENREKKIEDELNNQKRILMHIYASQKPI